jgi:hypothetical protein
MSHRLMQVSLRELFLLLLATGALIGWYVDRRQLQRQNAQMHEKYDMAKNLLLDDGYRLLTSDNFPVFVKRNLGGKH